MFQYSSTYAFECGGLTKDIIHLSNTDIKEYHAQFYNLDNTTIIITGQIDPKDVFDKLESIPGLLDINNNHVKDNNKEKKPTNNNNDDEEEEDSIEIDESPAPIIVIPAMPQLPSKLISQTVHFPTPDDSVGSIGYAWRGPLSEGTQVKKPRRGIVRVSE